MNNGVIRKVPYPPNLSKIAAKTIEPATGASTCALGSHKWTEKSGYFTKNPAKKLNVIPVLKSLVLFLIRLNRVKSKNLVACQRLVKTIKQIKRGKEANTVYKNKLILAERRSG